MAPEDETTILCYGICLIPIFIMLILLFIENRKNQQKKQNDKTDPK